MSDEGTRLYSWALTFKLELRNPKQTVAAAMHKFILRNFPLERTLDWLAIKLKKIALIILPIQLLGN